MNVDTRITRTTIGTAAVLAGGFWAYPASASFQPHMSNGVVASYWGLFVLGFLLR